MHALHAAVYTSLSAQRGVHTAAQEISSLLHVSTTCLLSAALIFALSVVYALRNALKKPA